ncbi:MAG: hypothetical protein O8C66_04590 [Candidatus Methanoperedens sp.]|nr:hypothetical protein [Candidatus Methanoperedens sp.]MCZ7369765.1 hypothetical protein [Candidatus Methanoperedens sp.]
MSKITHVVIESVLYDVQLLTAATLAEFVEDVPRYKLEDVLKNPSYKAIKKLNKIKI